MGIICLLIEHDKKKSIKLLFLLIKIIKNFFCRFFENKRKTKFKKNLNFIFNLNRNLLQQIFYIMNNFNYLF